MNQVLFRCSQLGKLMTEPKLKADKEAGLLSETTKTYIREIWLKNEYGYDEVVITDAMLKGLLCEQDAMQLVQDVQIHLDWLSKQIKELERNINDHIDRHPDLKRDAELLGSIPGIGDTTVAKVLAYAGNIRRFTNAKALAAFIGVTPRQRLSGSSIRGRTMMSRTGHGDLRRALYMPGMVARRHNPVLKIFGDRLSAVGLAPKAVIGAVMRKLAH